MHIFSQLFDSSTLSPHGICLLWRPVLLWIHVVSDALIGIAYFSIPLALASFVIRRRDMDFGWIFWLFALFILGCGTNPFHVDLDAMASRLRHRRHRQGGHRDRIGYHRRAAVAALAKSPATAIAQRA